MSHADPRYEPVHHAIARRAADEPGQLALSFLTGAGAVVDSLSVGELDRRARAVAQALSARPRGSRIPLLYLPSLDFAVGLLGAWYAGMVPVPMYPPEPGRLDRTVARLAAIARDCAAELLLTTDFIRAQSRGLIESVPELARLEWIASDRIASDRVAPDRLASDASPVEIAPASAGELALIQYTSGSTGDPKGVALSHGNLAANIESIVASWGLGPQWTMLSWLPMFHDMGLIGCLLMPLARGLECRLLSPLELLKDPLCWLRAISSVRGPTISGGPNFAYELCARRAPDAAAASAHDGPDAAQHALDLSRWQIAFNGAEPVRADTLERFAAAYASRGFRSSAFLPCYGLAEATLYVSGRPGREPTLLRVQRAELEAGRIRLAAEVADRDDTSECVRLAGCGLPGVAQEVAIVDPHTLERRPADTVGEVWVASDAIARTYWGREHEAEATFGATLPGSQRRFLRTGDLGFLHEGELIPVGRIKDVLIVRGSNHYPQDLERTVESCSDRLRPGCSAAFQLEPSDERIAIVAERRGTADAGDTELCERIRAALAQAHGLEAAPIVLLPPRAIPKTTSGKIQRSETRRQLRAGALEGAFVWHPVGARTRDERAHGSARDGDTPQREPAHGFAPHEVCSWLIADLAAHAGASSAELTPLHGFADLGLDSVRMVALVGRLERWLGMSLPPTLAWEFPTIGQLARHVCAPDSAASPRAALARTAQREPIAIVGIGARFPGADSPEAFWSLIREGREAIEEVPASRFDVEPLYDAQIGAPGKLSSRHGGFLRDVDRFDAAFFGLTPREAARIDPQHRVALEVAWEALLDAGIPADSLAGSQTGAFLGVTSFDYAGLLRNADDVDAHTLTGNAHSLLANRLSYLLDLAGPSLSVDTACSSSLVAVHLSCASLWSGESALALAGGVNLILAPQNSIGLTKAGVLAPDGRCKPFDASADGIVRSEGCGVVVLRRLSDAQEAGERIYALIAGSAVNSDGRTSGITAPNPRAQIDAIRSACASAGCAPADLDFVEAHGTGTQLGDRIELEALSRSVGRRGKRAPCAIGSVKANIGHAESAAGIAGLIKTALALWHAELPPHRLPTGAHADVRWGENGLALPAAPQPLAAQGARAGVSSFGFGGTNAHVVLATAPRAERPASAAAPEIFPLALSAHTPSALRALAARLGELEPATPQARYALARELALHRAHGRFRAAFAVGADTDVRQRLALIERDTPHPEIHAGRRTAPAQRGPVFLFSGLGSQALGMGRRLLASEPVFRESMQRCEALIRARTGWSLLAVLDDAGDARALEQLETCQPALWALQVSLGELLRSWGIAAAAVVGHSMGEVAAACHAGALSLEAGCAVICERSRLLARVAAQGRMAVASVDEPTARALIEELQAQVFLAGSNSPATLLLAGREADLVRLGARVAAGGEFFRLVAGQGFGHCSAVAPLAAELEQRLRDEKLGAPALPFYSSVSGAHAAGPLDAAYWRANLESPVRFHAVLQALLADGFESFVELSAHPILLPAVLDVARAEQREVATYPTLVRDVGADRALASCLARLFAAGSAPDWSAVLREPAPRPVRIPIPWERSRCWLPDSALRDPRAAGDGPHHPVLGHELRSPALGARRAWTLALPAERATLGDPLRQPAALAALLLDLCAAAARCCGIERARLELEALYPEGLLLDTRPALHVVATPQAAEQCAIELFAGAHGAEHPGWTRIAAARVERATSAPVHATAHATGSALEGAAIDGDDWFAGCVAAVLQEAESTRGVALAPTALTALRVHRAPEPGSALIAQLGLEANHSGGWQAKLDLFERSGACCAQLELQLQEQRAPAPGAETSHASERWTAAARRLQTAPRAARHQEVLRRLCALLAVRLQLPPDGVDPELSLAELGVDSLIAVDLRHRVESEFALELLPAEIGANPVLAQLADLLERRLFAESDG